MDIDTRKIKGTPYKAVISNKMVIGVFDREKYYDLDGMTSKHREAIKVFQNNGVQHVKQLG